MTTAANRILVDTNVLVYASLRNSPWHVQVQAAATGQLFNADVNLLARRVLVKVMDATAGKLVFRHGEAMTIMPEGDPVTAQLQIVEPKPQIAYGTPLLVEVLDADDEEILAHEDVTLKIDISDW